MTTSCVKEAAFLSRPQAAVWRGSDAAPADAAKHRFATVMNMT